MTSLNEFESELRKFIQTHIKTRIRIGEGGQYVVETPLGSIESSAPIQSDFTAGRYTVTRPAETPQPVYNRTITPPLEDEEPPKKPPKEKYPFRVLYWAEVSGTKYVYLGGDRSTPLLLLGVQADQFRGTVQSYGKSLGDWEVSLTAYGVGGVGITCLYVFRGEGSSFTTVATHSFTDVYFSFMPTGWGFFVGRGTPILAGNGREDYSLFKVKYGSVTTLPNSTRSYLGSGYLTANLTLVMSPSLTYTYASGLSDWSDAMKKWTAPGGSLDRPIVGSGFGDAVVIQGDWIPGGESVLTGQSEACYFRLGFGPVVSVATLSGRVLTTAVGSTLLKVSEGFTNAGYGPDEPMPALDSRWIVSAGDNNPVVTSTVSGGNGNASYEITLTRPLLVSATTGWIRIPEEENLWVQSSLRSDIIAAVLYAPSGGMGSGAYWRKYGTTLDLTDSIADWFPEWVKNPPSPFSDGVIGTVNSTLPQRTTIHEREEEGDVLIYAVDNNPQNDNYSPVFGDATGLPDITLINPKARFDLRRSVQNPETSSPFSGIVMRVNPDGTYKGVRLGTQYERVYGKVKALILPDGVNFNAAYQTGMIAVGFYPPTYISTEEE